LRVNGFAVGCYYFLRGLCLDCLQLVFETLTLATADQRVDQSFWVLHNNSNAFDAGVLGWSAVGPVVLELSACDFKSFEVDFVFREGELPPCFAG
jgi:hypothetical protein